MPMITDSIMRFAGQRRGLVTRSQLRSLGLDHRAIERLVAHGVLREIHEVATPAVLATGTENLGLEQQALAVCLQDGRLTISHGTCAQILHLRRAPRDQLEVSAAHDHQVTIRGLVVHRTNRLAGRDVTHRIDGLRLTSPARLIFDLAGILDLSALLSLTEDALNRRLVTPESLHDVGERLAGQGRRGSKTFRELLELHPGQRPPVGSEYEIELERALARLGLHPARQHPLRLPGGRTAHLDFGFVPERVGVEIDHWYWHLDRGSQQQDKSRDLAVASLGWLPLRFTEDDVRDRVGACAATVLDVLEVRQHQLGLARPA